VANPGADLPLSKEGKLNVGAGMGEGELTVIKDIGLKEPHLDGESQESDEMQDIPVKALTQRIFGEMPEEYRLKEVDLREISWHCDCSRQRLEQVVMAMGRKDLETIIQEDGGAELVCSFCNSKYYFDRKDLERIYHSIQ
jgi:redox-regulated HSP33 family molecular chaperone